MVRVQPHFVPHGELHVPSVFVKLGLAPVLALLQQRPHLRRHAAHESRSGLARRRPGGSGRVLAGRRVERTAGVLALDREGPILM